MATESGSPSHGSTQDQPPPPRAAPPPPERRSQAGPTVAFTPLPSRQRTGAARALTIALVTIGTLLVLVGSVVFLFGEDLFGSDQRTIDSYNEDVLESCDVPPESTLVRTFVLRVYDSAGRPYRSLSHVYAVPADADEVISFYDLLQPRDQRLISKERACRFSQRPLALVESLSGIGVTSPVDAITETGSTDVVDITELPPDTRTLFRLRLAQQEVEGLF